MTRPTGQQSERGQRLQELIRQFHDAWKSAADVDLRLFLPPPGDPLRRTALLELIKADLRVRWLRRRGSPLESYVERFPELGPLEKLDPEMLLVEYRARAQLGEPPEMNSYRERFPKQFAAFEPLAHEPSTRNEAEETTSLPAGDMPPPPTPHPTNPPAQQSVTGPAQPSSGANRTVQMAGGYQILKRLGQGSFAEVYQGIAPGGFPVAIKRILRPMDDDEAKRELQALERISQLRHPFLLQTHSLFVVEGHLHVVMELADGTLRDRQKECQKSGKGPIPLPELLRYFRESAEVLDYMHARKLMHRDIKPQNILISNAHAKLADFGLAVLHESQRALFSATSSGTPAYMAPEVWRGKVGDSTDQYSLAFAYAEQRLGRLPFEARDIPSLMMAHLNEAPELAPLPDEEQTVLKRALAKDPAERYPSCQEFVRALDVSLRDQLRISDPSFHIFAGDSESRLRGGAGLSGTLTPGTAGGSLGSKTVPLDGSGMPVPMWGPQRSSRRPWVVAATLGFLLLGVAAFFAFKEFRPSLGLEVPARVMVHPGEVKSARIELRRHRFDKPVTLSWHGMPGNVQVKETTLEPGDNSVDVPIAVGLDAAPGTTTIKIKASGDGGEQEKEIELVFEAPPAYKLAGEWTKPNDAQLVTAGDKAYYDKIDVLRDKMPVRFLLMTKTGPNDPQPFYIMQDKVWIGLYRKFVAHAEAKGEQLDSKAWEKEVPKKDDADEYPVLGVVVADADRFADWLGGKLPLPSQWDKAAGAFEKRGDGPYEGPYPFDPMKDKDKTEIAINREQEGPLKRGDAKKDISRFGCRDMAGNGLEWTGATAEDWSPEQPQRSTRENLTNGLVLTRGRDYTSSVPYTYGKGGAVTGTSMGTRVGFRVVIEP